MSDQVFTRDGHVLELALEAHLLGELEPSDLALLEAHCTTCAPCGERLEGLALPGLALPPLSAPRAEVVELGPRRTRAIMLPVLGLLAAGVLAAILIPADEPEIFGARGAGTLELEVYRHDGSEGVEVHDGDVVHPGERLGFRLTSDEDGHAMVVGVDEAGTVYPCWPQPEGRSVQLPASDEPTTLPTAVRLDDALGSETIVAIRCEQPFAFGGVADAVADQRAPAGCEVVELSLTKESP